MIELNTLQDRLCGHFDALARSRAETGLPIFALEHDLSEPELNQMSDGLRYRLAAGHAPAAHWLLWAIYATEQGYGYAGGEYWESFEHHTPNWQFSDRNRIKPWFRKFQNAYHGVVPSGAWANQFSIIAWPITHAILPRYLQMQFARALYDLRFRLASLTTLDAAGIGRLLAANSYHASTRFRQFLEQEELTGRIVLAMLGTDSSDGHEPIFRPTLRRIVADLEKVRSAREWLKDTRRVVADRFVGIGRGASPRIPSGQGMLPLPSDELKVTVRPRLMLRHVGSGTWTVFLDVPSLKSLAALNGEVRNVLQEARCIVNGSSEKKPAGWVLAARRAPLRHWPDPSIPLLQFERPNAVLTHLLEAECRLESGPNWLFSIGSDGIARNVVGRLVRPGQSYIVVTLSELPASRPEVSGCNLDCEGVLAFRLTMPATVSSEFTAWIAQIGLQVARSIRVWAAGLPSRGWDGEGMSEWLTTETPCLGISHDHPVAAYIMRLNEWTETVITPETPSKPSFVKLPRLPVGTHLLAIRARQDLRGVSTASSPPEGHMQLVVRDPEPWSPGVTTYSGMIITADPPSDDLDTLWKNEVSLSVNGPESHAVAISVSLESGDGREVLHEEIARFELPLTCEQWQRRFGQFLEREDRAWSYLEATRGVLTIDGENLGRRQIQFEHDVQPLRWVPRRDHGKVMIRLVDDTGDDETDARIKFWSMDHPVCSQPIKTEDALSGFEVAPPGGLFLASRGSHRDIVIISTGVTKQGLQGLSVDPQLTELWSGKVTHSKAVRVLGTWQSARLYGFLADIRRQQVTRAINDAIVRSLCGARWATVEDRFKRNPQSRQNLEHLRAEVDRLPSFAAVLCRERSLLDGDSELRGRRFAEIASRYGICSNEALSRLALRLAEGSAKPTVSLANDDVMKRLAQQPALIRGARLLALMHEAVDGRADRPPS